MDVFSHALWGGLALGRQGRRDYLAAMAFSLLPDLLGEGVMFTLALLGLDGMPSLAQGHPNITQFPPWARTFYNFGHSLIVFAVLFTLVWWLRGRPCLPLAGWGLHVLVDIPCHSVALFPTPFLWPLSDFKVDGLPWGSPWILVPNFLLLTGGYLLWLRKRGNEA